MAKKKQQPPSEGKAGVIITLAFFMILSGLLGYTTYEFYSQIEGANEAKKKAEEEATAAKKLTQEEKDRVAFYKAFIGVATKDEEDIVKSFKPDGPMRQEHDALMKFVQGQIDGAIKVQATSLVGLPGGEFKVAPADTITWPWAATGALPAAPGPRPLISRIVELYGQRELAFRKVAQQLKNAQDLEARLKDERTAYETEKAALQAAVKKIPEEAMAKENERNALVATRLKDFEKFLQAYRLNKKDVETANNELKNQQEEAFKLLGQIKELNEKLASKDAEKDDQFPFDTPKGVVENRRGNLVEINLGYADNVKPGLTFTVQPVEVKERGLQSRIRKVFEGNKEVQKIMPKGTIEVVEVLGPNLSSARVTEEDQPVREPIMKTDLLYNAAWRKGQADHIVLVGVFDIDGDGTDDIKQVVREIGRMGITIDGYYDLVERKWLMGGPSPKTNYVVEGEYPRPSAGDQLLTVKSELSNVIANAKKEAVDQGAKAVRYRDFFPRIGYKAKYDVTDDRINQAAAKFLKTPLDMPPEAAPKN